MRRAERLKDILILTKRIVDFFLDRLATFVVETARRMKHRHVLLQTANFPGIASSASFGPNVNIIAPPGSVVIGAGTYINDAIISASDVYHVTIGERCAIGYRVSIKAVTHDPSNPAPNEHGAIAHIGAPISIGNRCWIGDNVFIREGVNLGDDVVVGANSVVTRSFPSHSTIAGAPARVIRSK